jgi:Tfp pilus assembly PilM family ATPase
MSRLVALEWDAKEARVAVGRARAGGVAVEQMFVVPLPQREEGAGGEPDIGAALARGLAEHGISRSEALVAVGRANIELRFLSTPPVPEEELPDVVRFQAVRSFTTFGDEWPLDFVPLEPNADGGMNVLAAAISPDLLEQIRKDCLAAGITISRLVLRPFAAAALLKDQLADGKCRMIVDLLRDEADLTVLIGPKVIFPRTVRLPLVSEADVLARTLLAEGRRTMIAAQNQLGGRKVEEVIIFGDGQHHATLKALLEKELSLPVHLLDPLERVEWADSRAKKPEYPGTFAPLLGLLVEESTGIAPVIDFLHPKKKKPPRDYRKQYLYAGGAVAAVVLLGLSVMQWQLRNLDVEINDLKVARFKAEKAAKDAAKPIADAKLLDDFTAADMTWLDEMALVSARLPPPDAAMVTELVFQGQPPGPGGSRGGGTIKVVGHVDKPDRIGELEESLRDKQHTVHGKGTGEDANRQDLRWSFEELIAIGSPLERPTAGPAKNAAEAQKPAASDKKGGGQ